MRNGVALVFFLYATSACAGHHEDPLPRAELNGTWTLDAAESQNPVSMLSIGRETPTGLFGGDGEGVGGRATGGRAGGGRGDTRPRQGFGPDMKKIETAEGKLALLNEMHQKVVIADSGAIVAMSYAVGPRMRYDARGKERADSIPALGVVKSEASWKDGSFFLEQRIGSLKLKEEYVRGPNSSRLIVFSKVEGLARPLEYRRVYSITR